MGGRLRIVMFGELSIDRSGQAVACSSAKALELLCYLVIHHERPHRREGLATLLWPDENLSAGRRHLRQALWKLNRSMPGTNSGAGGGAGILRAAAPGWLQIDGRIADGCDLVLFERTRATTRDIPGPDLADDDVARIEAALAAYRGDLLAAWPAEWCMPDRLRAREGYLAMLEQMMAYHQDRGRFERGLRYGATALRQDPARESVHRRMMVLHHRAGDRTAAIRQYQLCLRVLDEELGIRPSAATMELHQQICADRPGSVPLQYAAPSRDEADLLAALSRQLDSIQDALSQLRSVIEGERRPRLSSARRDAG